MIYCVSPNRVPRPISITLAFEETDVERVIETAELDEDAASEPVMVLDEAAQTALEDMLLGLHLASTCKYRS